MKKYTLLAINMILTGLIQADSLPILFGTSQGRNNGSKGIYAAELNPSTGKFSDTPRLVAEINSPGFQVLHDTLPILYSIGATVADNEPAVFSFSIHTGKGQASLEPINQQPTLAGRSAHLDIDPEGRMLVSAQYGDGTVSVFPVSGDGKLLPTTQIIQHTYFSKANPQRQEKAHPHNVTFDPSGAFALVPDLGADMVYVYKADYEKNQLALHDRVKTAPASGPRHMKFSQDGRYAYVLNELSLTVDAYAWDAGSGRLSHLATVDGLPENMRQPGVTNTASEIRIHPNGRFLYTAIRGVNAISVFSIDPNTNIPVLLEAVPSQVDWPRNFAITLGGHWLICAGHYSNDVAVFSVDPDTGKIKFQPNSLISVPGPICVVPLDD